MAFNYINSILIIFFYRNITNLVLVSFSFLKNNNTKKTNFLNSDKSEPVLYRRKSVLSKSYKPKTTKQNLELDNYYYKLPDIDLFSKTSVKKTKRKKFKD